MKRILIIALMLLVTGIGISAEDRYPDLRTGDILFQSYSSTQSDQLQLTSGSNLNNVGVVFVNDNIPLIWESVQPVRITFFEEWVQRDPEQYFVVKRLKNASQILTKECIDKMNNYAREQLGKNYDLFYQWSDTLFYSPEFVWKIFKEGCGIELCPLKKMSDLNLKHPDVRDTLFIRYGDSIPMNEPVVTIQDIYNSDLLEKIYVSNPLDSLPQAPDSTSFLNKFKKK